MESVTPAQLNDPTHAVNTTGKVPGRMVFLLRSNDTPRPVWAWGSAPTSPWGDADGKLVETPNVPSDFRELGIG